MDGKALDVALALWRLPSMRAALRQRPLPDGVGELVELTAGASARIADAAARADTTPQELLEAVRFYASEILMHDSADAYRVLGVGPDAAPGQIKAHHRALQQWLHPDRRGGGWASVYAARVNVAWSELRSPERRAAYDARLAQPLPASEPGVEPRRVLVTDWRIAPDNQRQWRGWAALAAVVAVCTVLIVLIEQQASVPAPEWVVASDDSPVESPEPLQLELAALAERVAAQPPKPTPITAAARPAEVPVAAMESVAVTTVPTPVAAIAMQQPPVEASPAPVVRDSAPSPAAPAIVLAPVAASVQKPAPKVVSMPPRMTARKPPVPAITAATNTAPVRSIALAPRADPKPDSAPMPTAVDALERVRLAHLRGREVTRYLSGPSSPTPPIWRSVAAQDAGAAVRQRLDGGRSRIGRMLNAVRFGEPDWRISADHATMTASIERSRTGTADPNTLHVELAWREGMWLVDTIEAENLP